MYDLAHVLHMDVPAFEGRMFCQELDAPQSVPGSHGLGFVIERVHAPSQMGTHLDGLNHLHKDGRTYNGHRIADIAAPYGTTKLGADTLPQVVTRGLLVDVAARRGVARLDAGDVITPDDVAGVDVRPGDAVLVPHRLGPAVARRPGTLRRRVSPVPGMALAEWLADHRVALTGCDTWSYGPVPAEDPDQPFVVPQTLNTRDGVVVVENLFLQRARPATRVARVPARDRPSEAVRRHRRLGRTPRHRLRSERSRHLRSPLDRPGRIELRTEGDGHA